MSRVPQMSEEEWPGDVEAYIGTRQKYRLNDGPTI